MRKLYQVHIDIMDGLDIDRSLRVLYEDRDEALVTLGDFAISYMDKWEVPQKADKVWRRVEISNDSYHFETFWKDVPEDEVRRFIGHIFEETLMDPDDDIVAIPGQVFKFIEAENVFFTVMEPATNGSRIMCRNLVDMNTREFTQLPPLADNGVELVDAKEEREYNKVLDELFNIK